jgi:hypothetical protein
MLAVFRSAGPILMVAERTPTKSIGDLIGEMDKDQLGYLAGSQTRQIEELQGEVERLRDWSSGSNANGVAVSNLAQIVSDSTTASTRQRLRAAAAVLGYKVQDAGIIEFAKRFLESLGRGCRYCY